MKYAVDWATNKDYKVRSVESEKVKTLPNSIEAWRKWLKGIKPSEFYLEEGGGDSFKLLARKLGHRVFTTPGIFVKRQRDKFGLEKEDDIDTLVITKVVKLQPDIFREFVEEDVLTSKVYLAYKQLEKTEKTMVQEKLRLFALKIKLELYDLDGFAGEQIKSQENVVKAKQKKFNTDTKLLRKLVHELPEWKEFFKPIKGCGERTAGGMKGSIKRSDRFPHKYCLRSYAGMKKKKGDQDFKHELKRALYFFAKGIIKAKNKKWYSLYLETKKFYAEKHPDWRKGKIDAYAMKFIETKFLDKYYDYCKNGDRNS